jgi:K+-transporting ATPase ATPase C chain
MRRDLLNSALAVLLLTVLLGLAYPLLSTGAAQLLFPGKANGSRVEVEDEVVGSELIGQDFRRPVLSESGEPSLDAEGELLLEPDPAYFQSRPSVTGYNPAGTGFANLGPNSTELREAFEESLEGYLKLERPYNPGLTAADVPVDAVANSASGVDPHISQANARIQAHRVAAVRKLSLDRVAALINANTDGRSLGLLGEPGVNVLALNLAIDEEASR